MGPTRVVVLDTNILVSALGWEGPERKVYELCRTGELRQVTSPLLLEELRRVLQYPKLGIHSDEARAFVADVAACATIVRPKATVRVVQEDPPDNRVLECALEGGADQIVSGDSHLLNLASFRGIDVVNAVQLLDDIGQRGT